MKNKNFQPQVCACAASTNLTGTKGRAEMGGRMKGHGIKGWGMKRCKAACRRAKREGMGGCRALHHRAEGHGMVHRREKGRRAECHKMTAAARLFFAALGLLLLASADTSLSYFTTYVSASGGRNVTLGESTYLEEDVKPEGGILRKEVQVLNTGETDCYIRVKVFAGSQVNQTEKQPAISVTGGGWGLNGEDGFWYYGEAVPAGGSTQVLTVEITPPTEEDRESLGIESFDVIVIQECTRVRYDEGGNAYADWDAAAVTEEGEGA